MFSIFGESHNSEAAKEAPSLDCIARAIRALGKDRVADILPHPLKIETYYPLHSSCWIEIYAKAQDLEKVVVWYWNSGEEPCDPDKQGYWQRVGLPVNGYQPETEWAHKKLNKAFEQIVALHEAKEQAIKERLEQEKLKKEIRKKETLEIYKRLLNGNDK